MRRCPACIQTFRQRDQVVFRTSVSVFKCYARTARQYPVLFVERMIIRLLRVESVEICLRSEPRPCKKLLRRKIPAAGGVQRIVSCVMHPGNAWTTDASRLREQWNQGRADLQTIWIDIDVPIRHRINKGVASIRTLCKQPGSADG